MSKGWLRGLVAALLTWFCVSAWGAETNSLLPVRTMESKTAGNRTIRICLPAGYFKTATAKYPVLYVHDGQDVFSSAGTNAGFGWGNWELDITSRNLAQARQMQEIIIVGIDSSKKRRTEYSGQISLDTNNPSDFDNYSSFLRTELKPLIDREYRTLTGPENTGVMGSSLGGICSLALAWAHPEVFGKAASLSGAFQIDNQEFIKQTLHTYQGKPKPLRLYIDSGVTDYSGGDDNRAYSADVVAELKRIGWKEDLAYFLDAHPLTETELANSGLRPDKWEEAGRSQHNEFYWRRRANRPLTFLFPPTH